MPGTPGTPNAMHVVFGLRGEVVVHHVIDPFDVDAAGEHVGGNEDVGGAVGEIVERAPALVLAAAGVDRLNRVAGFFEAPAGRIGTASRAGEHDDALMPAFGQHALEQSGLDCLLHVDDVLLDGVGRLAASGDLHRCGVV